APGELGGAPKAPGNPPVGEGAVGATPAPDGVPRELLDAVQSDAPSELPENSCRNWVTLPGRSSRFLASARATARRWRSGSLAPPGCASMGVGCAVRCLVAHSQGVAAVKGSTPVNIS